jgi:hypothetical protein
LRFSASKEPFLHGDDVVNVSFFNTKNGIEHL